MQGDAAVHRQRGEKLAHQFGVERADLRRGEIHLPHQIRPSAEVQRGAHQGVVHRQQAGAIAADSALVSQRLHQRLAERNAGILDRVVVVDMGVALGLDGEVDQRMPRQLVQHMVEEPDPGPVVVLPGAVEVHGDLDRGFRGLAR